MELKVDLEDTVAIKLEEVAKKVWETTFKEEIIRKSYPEYMNFKEAAQYMGISVDIFRKLIREQGVPVISIPGTTVRRVSKTSLDTFILSFEK